MILVFILSIFAIFLAPVAFLIGYDALTYKATKFDRDSYLLGFHVNTLTGRTLGAISITLSLMLLFIGISCFVVSLGSFLV